MDTYDISNHSYAPLPSGFLETLSQSLDGAALIAGSEIAVRYLEDSLGTHFGRYGALVRPETTAQVAKILQACHHYHVAVIPQGGNTGRCAGATAQLQRASILLSLERMNKIRAFHADDESVTVDAGLVLADLQKFAADNARFFPVSLGAEGSCQIGGNLASNAGGINVLHYGSMRAQMLGLEAVMADGQIFDGLKRLTKDNSGYDLKHLLVGSEGTLGIITGACLKLSPPLRQHATAFLTLKNPHQAVALLKLMRAESGNRVIAFELIPDLAFQLLSTHANPVRLPFAVGDSPWYVLVEFAESSPHIALRPLAENLIMAGYEAGLIGQAVVAENEQHRKDFWKIREALVYVQKQEGYAIKHDISVSPADIAALIDRVETAITKLVPHIRPYPFGHVGDGNIHFNFCKPCNWTDAAFQAVEADVHQAVYQIIREFNGSISAEHGIGRIKVAYLHAQIGQTAYDQMRKIKQSLDPHNILNPGVLFDISQTDLATNTPNDHAISQP